MIYKQKNSKFYWCAFRIPGTKKLLRRSTRTDNKIKAEAIAQTIKLALHRESPAAPLHALIDTLLADEVKEAQPVQGTALEALSSEYEHVIASIGRVVSPKTITGRHRAINKLIEWRNEVRPDIKTIESMDAFAIRLFAADLARKRISTKTRRNIISDIITVLKSLGFPVTAWQGIMPTDTDSKVRDAFSAADEKKVLDAAKIVGNDWYPLSLISRYTGLRLGDCLSLTCSNLDQECMAIRIKPNKTKKHGIYVTIPLPKKIWEEIALQTKIGDRKTDERLFPDHDKYMNQFADVLKLAGIKGNFTFHSWRHTFRTRLSEAGISDDIAMRLGGWTQTSTASRYDHAERIEELRAAVEATV